VRIPCASQRVLTIAILLAVALGATATAAPPTVAVALQAIDGLPFDGFIEESYRQVMLRDPHGLGMGSRELLRSG